MAISSALTLRNDNLSYYKVMVIEFLVSQTCLHLFSASDQPFKINDYMTPARALTLCEIDSKRSGIMHVSIQIALD